MALILVLAPSAWPGQGAWEIHLLRHPELLGALSISKNNIGSLERVMEKTLFAPHQIADLPAKEQAEFIRQRVRLRARQVLSRNDVDAAELRELLGVSTLVPDLRSRLIEKKLSLSNEPRWEGGDKQDTDAIAVAAPLTKRARLIETMISLDYRKGAWGQERVVLDSISNHLPADSGGTRATVRLLQGGRWLELREADPTKPTEQIAFEDNGKGYDVGLLSLMFSTKQEERASVGQFGEGLKMVAAAALRLGIRLQYQSKNWTATPERQDVQVDGQSIAKLNFKIEEGGPPIQGSRTLFTNPPQALIDEVFRLPQKVLAFNRDYKELYRKLAISLTDLFLVEDISRSGATNRPKAVFSRILDLGRSQPGVFIKGVRVSGMRENALFSYDLATEKISPDRAVVDSQALLSEIQVLLKGTDNSEVVEKILQTAKLDPRGRYYEFSAIGWNPREKFNNPAGADRIWTGSLYGGCADRPNPSSPWGKAFHRLFGERAVLASTDIFDTGTNKDAAIMGYTPIELNREIHEYLSCLGVRTADSVNKEQRVAWVHEDDLSEPEKAMLARAAEINQALGITVSVPIRVFAGIFLPSGREVDTNDDIHAIKGFAPTAGEEKYVAIRQTNLKNFWDFARVYIHELGHFITGADDYSRAFTDFFVKALADGLAPAEATARNPAPPAGSIEAFMCKLRRLFQSADRVLQDHNL